MTSKILKLTKTVFTLGSALLVSTASLAHDFWLAPETYSLETPAVVDVSVMIGHPEDKLAWPVSPHRIIGLRSVGPNGLRDHQSAMADYMPSKSLLWPLGLTLEIVPLQNPARLAEGDTFTSRVYYRGSPATGVTIGLIDLDSDDGILAIEKTNATGLVKFDRPKAGSWMLHAVWADSLPESKTAEYDTIFSSLSFEVK